MELNAYIKNNEVCIEFDCNSEEDIVHKVAIQNLRDIIEDMIPEIKDRLLDVTQEGIEFIKESKQSYPALLNY